MKLFIFIFFLFFLSSPTNAGTYYISPAGNDVTGNGTITNPWKTLYKATQSVTISGDIIHVNAGTYTETQQCNLAVGVSIEGDGATSIIKSTLTADWTAIIVATSNTEATNGNQHISNLYFDGQVAGTSGGTAWCIVMRGRKNFSIHDCSFVNFRQSACIFAGRTDNAGAAPAIFPTGNSFYNNVVNNCAEYNYGAGQGCLMIGGQEGMLIYNNSISQTSRPVGFNGWPIKYYNDGFLNGCKIYNNILNKNPLGSGLGASDWDFAIELFRESGLEIYGNTITGGGIDLNYQSKGNYTYSVWIHDNNIKMNTLNTFLEHAITLEFESKDVIVENNTMDKFNTGIRFVPRNTDTVKNITIRRNLITNGGFGEGTGFHINFGGGTQTNYYNNINVFNNTMVMDFANRTWFGIRLPDVSSGFIKNIHLRNNIIANSLSAGIIHSGGAVAIDSLNIDNNDIYNNGNNNNAVFNGPAPTHYTFSNNLNTVPTYGASYTLTAGSPLIDAGINVGLSFNGSAPDMGYAESGSVSSNLPPSSNAGLDQNITLPTNSVSLTGSGNDPDGSIIAYLWTKVSGPTAGTITNASLAATSVTTLVAGIYKFELRVTDNSGAVARDTMQVTVNAAANIAPTANAGLDQNITFPTNSVSLTGSGNDPDGSISAYLWTKVSGPTAGTITNTASAATTVTTLVAGIYKFELRVTDNSGAVARDTMQVTVNAAANIAPTVNAGLDQNITLPTNTVNLTGSGNDPDGSISAYLWTKVSGPTAGTITNASLAATSVTALVAGIYKFELRVTDNSGAVARDTMQVTVNAAGNIAPTANAGANQSITLPVNSSTLLGSGNDPDGSISAYLWTKVSGPTAGTITNATAAVSSVTGLVQGVYLFELKVTDNSGAVARDTMQLTVNAAANIAPTANAGLDQNITLPTNTVNLTGSGNDPDGSISAYLWTKVSGPTAGTITNASLAATSATSLVAGIYKFELRVTDNSGAVARDTMQVTVNAAANIAPTANAGANQSITLPVNSSTLLGSGNDPDGSISAYLWTKVSGPTAGTITNATAAVSSVTGLVQGVYLFELKVTDNSGAVARDTMQLTVNAAANIAPTANAGLDQNITLPTNTVNLTGSGNDPDGSISAYLWTKVSGPTAGTISNTASAATTVTALVAGIYKFELKVTDNSGAVTRDTMQVTVNAAANIAPTANAGANQSITLPVNSSTLLGSGNDPDGSISAYLWTKVSGPTAGTITNATAAVSSVTGLVQGVYLFELKVTDNSGAVARDTMQLTVNAAANIAPTANAGLDQNITLPTNTVNLTGSGNDPDGSISAYLWTKVSGPTAGTISNTASAATTVTALVAGIYKFELRVTDNSGAVARDTMQVIVFAPNITPTANAGLDQSITLPTNTADLIGSGSDLDGTIVAYKWTRISGPANGTIANAATAVTSVSGLTQGVYVFELRVTDNNGGSSTDIMQVTVNAANIPPVANAGPDQLVALPLNSATLNGSGTDADGTVISYKWRQISGPADKLTSLNTPVTVLNSLIEGVYVFELTVTDNKNATDIDTAIVTVKSVTAPSLSTVRLYPNPVVNATSLELNVTTANTTVLLVITDMQGKVIQQKKIAISNYYFKEKIDMSALASGVYAITVHFNSMERKTIMALKSN